jgi:hypothetical protein
MGRISSGRDEMRIVETYLGGCCVSLQSVHQDHGEQTAHSCGVDACIESHMLCIKVAPRIKVHFREDVVLRLRTS